MTGETTIDSTDLRLLDRPKHELINRVPRLTSGLASVQGWVSGSWPWLVPRISLREGVFEELDPLLVFLRETLLSEDGLPEIVAPFCTSHKPAVRFDEVPTRRTFPTSAPPGFTQNSPVRFAIFGDPSASPSVNNFVVFPTRLGLAALALQLLHTRSDDSEIVGSTHSASSPASFWRG